MTSLGAVLESSWRVTVGFAALTGACFHQTIRPFEVDNYGWGLVLAYLGLVGSLFMSYMISTSFSVTKGILHTWAAGAAFLGGFYGSMLLYRAFFHPLRKFPGPAAARLSNAYHFTIAARTNMQYHLHLQKLHQRYGDFVRTGPRELSVIRESAINLLYSSSSVCKKATWYDQNSGDPDAVSVQSVRDKEKHRLRRRAWDRGLGFRALGTYKTRLKAKVDLLLSRIGTGKPVDMTEYGMFYSFDVMGDIGFSKDFQMLLTGEEHPAVAGLHEALDIAGLFTTIPWLMNMLRVVPGATGKFDKFARWCREELNLKRRSLDSAISADKDYEPHDVMSWLIKAQRDHTGAPTEAAMQEDSRILVMAGSDTVASAFTNALYYLAKNPRVYEIIQHLMETEFPGGYEEWTYDRAKAVPYLDYIIHETLRLRPPTPIGFLRQTPPEGLQIDEVFVPGDTVISVPTWAVQRDPRYFEKADEFVPERWEKLSPDKSAYISFQRGPYACVGKQLAMMQLRILISCIALRYHIVFAPGEDGVAFATGEKEKMTLWVPPLHIVFTPK
ncbi:cytochrome P450 [Durotheca rogersii]|uniref:cytochrome P450 n=1 Tax=Durotheca rogersii TaxID=419775 RepID=UPI00221F1C93|nr:cytochrome P450 [Durotheca rogersii]KAI5861150.1 cytochrome P450 [Durotheca rogersii]